MLDQATQKSEFSMNGNKNLIAFIDLLGTLARFQSMVMFTTRIDKNTTLK